MRWICKDDIEECLTEEWRVQAAALKKALLEAPDQARRKQIINKSSEIWRKYYELLPDNFKRKCWYCEAEEIRSDMPVDHFRPKNMVEGEKENNGYWWLAFDWENYRCACTFCNSRRNFEESQGGKACKFPLLNPDNRAVKPEDDISIEQLNFLDPFKPQDEKLLWFDNDGFPIPNPNITPAEVEKVENSVDIFHLHETRIVRARNRIRITVDTLVKKLRNNSNDEESFSKLKSMVREKEKLSRTAIVYLSAHRDLPKVKEILNLD
ncbi:hypothetical protein MKL42_02310 [Acinetobacter sp. AOR15_HL]|uniref:hypothetical protein n=1 Tax=unclassified Acinetobacter TaxID=196816 RepID=UPI0022EB9FF2|nr:MULTISPECIES: hypothetical protein [unclassified Acinetobacter]MDA3556353.1 hypothetical protein [Acinetobacter sp. AOR15_HL]MDA3571810.1 hypothetical protein [Acinetobacter sp. AOR14_HL]